MDEIQVTFFSLDDLISSKLWHSFLSEIEICVGEKLSHIDIKDPVRKKVTSIQSAANYICDFDSQETSRTLFGKFGKSKISLIISLNEINASEFPHKLSFYFPSKLLKNNEGIQTILSVFKLGNEYLKPFYSYGDEIDQVSGKRKATRRAVDLEVELIGVFWLTYLNKKYIDFFEKERIEKLSNLGVDLSFNDDGVEFRVGDIPANSNSIGMRLSAEKILGADSFVDPNLTFNKVIGKQALSFSQLINE